MIMKINRTIISAVIAFVMFSPQPTFASSCEAISNSDRRNYCRATTKNQPHHCEAIKEADSRNYCRAVVKGQKHHCEAIKDKDTRNQCRANFWSAMKSAQSADKAHLLSSCVWEKSLRWPISRLQLQISKNRHQLNFPLRCKFLALALAMLMFMPPELLK